VLADVLVVAVSLRTALTRCARAAAAVLAAFVVSSCRSTVSLPPDLVLHSGRIITVNARFDVADALAIRGDRIVAVGPGSDIVRLRGPETRMIDLRGRTVIPGLIDSHSHVTSYGMHVFRPDLSKATSVADIVALIKAKVDASKPGEWVTNSRIWNETKLAERRSPTRFDLDPISPGNPVYLSRGHLGVINSAAMKVLGITDRTPDPPGGTLERDPGTGQFTGRLYETALDLVTAVLPGPTRDQIMEAQRQSYRELAAAGVTSVRSASEDAGAMRVFLALRALGELPLRTSVMIRLNPNVPAPELEKFLANAPVSSGLGDDMLRVWGVKMVADGGSDLALLRKDYANRPGFRGQAGGTRESFTTAVRLCNKYGWRVGIHALGDAAIDLVLDAYEAADRDSPIAGKRWSIEHGYLLQPDQYRRLERLAVTVHPQTWHLFNLRRNFVENYGREYADRSHPYRTLLDHGIPIAGGMDWPVEPRDPFFYMWVEITRSTIDGEVVGPEQALTREDALRLHTIWAAYSTFEETVKGSLEAGKLADLVVLSDDYLTVPEERIKTITPLLTMVGGKIVFRKDGQIVP
jgi:predicted amidohydrolase YtcJ